MSCGRIFIAVGRYSLSCEFETASVNGQRSDPSVERTILQCCNSLRTCWGGGYTCTQSLFPDLQARGLALQLKYRDSFAGKYIWAVKGQWPKISVVNSQTAEKSRSKLWPTVAAVTIESTGVTPPCHPKVIFHLLYSKRSPLITPWRVGLQKFWLLSLNSHQLMLVFVPMLVTTLLYLTPVRNTYGFLLVFMTTMNHIQWIFLNAAWLGMSFIFLQIPSLFE